MRGAGFFRRLARLRGVPQSRHVVERAVAPYLRADLHSLHNTTLELNHRLTAVEAAISGIERHLPDVLNAITSTNGTTRVLRREFDEILREQVAPHVATIAYLLQRVETVRAEFMHELRYGHQQGAERVSPEIVSPEAVAREGADLRLNLGCGHLVLDDYVNVDQRRLPGVDVVALCDDLPFAPESLAEIRMDHMLEHFPEEQIRRTLLPYWWSLLRSGGKLHVTVPDTAAMIDAYHSRSISFEQLRQVMYGGQEYAGDFHFTGFTTASLCAIIEEAGFTACEVRAQGRPNGDCLEMEIVATKPEG